ncbi:hypothetical protein ALQ18_01010 [Pseudomonas marginalis pv. marginalis]|nr:hypothetical protein ALQ18_01010 [Pseudomonas marginalis pv. marginalis]
MSDEPIDLDVAPYPPAFVALDKTKYPEEAVYGLGTDHVTPEARFFFEPWPAVSNGDYFGLRIHELNNPAAFDTVRDPTLKRYELRVPKQQLPEGTVDMLGRVVRVGSGQVSRSITQKILIKTTKPGGDDRRVLEPWHSELVMTIISAAAGTPLVDGDTLDNETIAGGLVCLIYKYPNIRKNDEISVIFDGKPITYSVSPAEADGPGPIRVPISESDIRSASQYGSVEVFFKVKDVVGNVSGGKYPYSKPITLRSELDETLLAGPSFTAKAPGADEGEETKIADLDTQSAFEFALTAAVTRLRVAPKPAHKIIFFLDITPKEGASWVKEFPPIIDRNLGSERLPISFDFLNGLAGGMFRARFEWRNAAGALVNKSVTTMVRVVGTQILMPPVITAQIEEGLIVESADLSLQIPAYQPHDPNWPEALWIKPLQTIGGLEAYSETQFAGPQGGTRRVTVQNLQKLKGKGYVAVGYSTNEGREGADVIRNSRTLIAQIGERDPVLLAPIVQGVLDNNIDPKKIKDPEILINIPYDGTVIGNVLAWSVVGQNQAGSASGSLPITKASAGAALPTLGIPVPRLVLDNNEETIISFTYSVTDKTTTPPKILRSEVRYISVGKALKLEIPKVLEAGTRQDQINLQDVLYGAHIEIAIKPLRDEDQVFAQWKGIYGVSSIELQLEGDSTTNKVVAFVPREVIGKAIRPHGNTISVSYNFTRGPFDYRSVTRDYKLPPPAGLPAPRIDAFELGVLPLYELKEGARYQADVWDFIDANQYVWLTATGTFADGSPYERDIFSEALVTEFDVTHGISAKVPVDELRQLKENSHLTLRMWVNYAQIPNKDTAVPFGARDYIIQPIPSVLPAPAFANKAGAAIAIEPLVYEHNAFVTVAYPGMTATQTITLQWSFPDGTQATIAPQKGLAGGKVDFPINAQILAASVGKIITLHYTSFSGTKTTSSDIQTLTVQTLRLADLPRALINGIANAGKLDVDNFQGTFALTLPKWPLSVERQLVTITARSHGVLPLQVLENYPINATEVTKGLVNTPFLKSWLLALPTNSAVELSCEVAYDGKADSLVNVQFPTTTYSVITAQTLITDTASLQNFSFGGWRPGIAVADARDLSFSAQGLLNYTYSNYSAGPILIKTFYNMRIGTRYMFSINIRREDGRYSLPVVSLYTSQGLLVAPTYIGSMAYFQMAGYFIANTATVECMIYSNNAGSYGNDYRVANLVVTRA